MWGGSDTRGAGDHHDNLDASAPPDGAQYHPILAMNSCLCSLLLSGVLVSAASRAETVISHWDFNSVPTTTEATNSPPPSVGEGLATLIGGVTATLSSGLPGSPGGRAWNTARFAAQGQSNETAGVRFAVSTVGVEQIRLQLHHRFSARSSGRAVVRASVNGTDFIDVSSYQAPGTDLWTNVVVDLTALSDASDNASFAFEVVAGFAADTNRYAAAGPASAYAPSGTWRFDDVTVSGEPVLHSPGEPRIRVSPSSQTVVAGATLRLGVGASGAAPLEYQWQRDGVDLPDETGPNLVREIVTADMAGRYRVAVMNALGKAISDEAVVTVTPAPPQFVAVDCGSLHAMVTAPDFAWPTGGPLVAVEGIVTTHANLTSSENCLFYVEDTTGGMAVFWRGQSAEGLPPAGSRVRVVGPVVQSGGLLQLAPEVGHPVHAVTVLEQDLPLPDPVELDFEWLSDAVRMEALEGRRVRVSGVTLDTRSPLFPEKGANLTLTSVETEATLTLRLDGDSLSARVDLAGQPKPTGPFSVTGVWSQSDSSRPFSGGYRLLPTRYEDLVLDGLPPEVRWTVTLENLLRTGDAATNDFTEQVLRPGETLQLKAEFSDVAGEVQPAADITLPDGARVTWASSPGSESEPSRLTAEVVFTATVAHAGQRHRILLPVAGPEAIRRAAWTVYVPSAAEQQVLLTEFLVNPAIRPDLPGFNPLHREDWPPAADATLAAKIGVWDEFVELVNLGPISVNLGGWTISDSTRIRAWISPENAAATIRSGQALILFGGPANSHAPRLASPAIPAALAGGASAGSDGLGLNNTSDVILIRNAAGNLVERIVYATRQLAADGSVARWPLPDGPWVAHSKLNPSQSASPGLPPVGDNWPGFVTPDPLMVQVQINGDQIRLTWPGNRSATYSVREATDGSAVWKTLAMELNEPEFSTTLDDRGVRLFQVTSP